MGGRPPGQHRQHQGRGLADGLVVPPRRGDRPVGRVHLGEQRVLRVGSGRGRPRRDLGHAGPADLLQERRRPQGAGAALAPPVARAAQPERRPGGRHVHQPALLGQVPGRARLAEGLERGSVEPEELGQVPRVPAQAERDQPRVVRPPGGHPGPGREHLRPLPHRQAGHEHGRPLQALGRVHGQQLDRVRLADPPGLQAELLLLGRGQVGQERAEGRLGALAGERVRHVGEGVQVGARRDRVDPGPRGDLDVQAEHALRLRGQVGERPADVRAQPPQLAGQGVHPRVAGPRVGGGLAQVVERLDQAAGLRGEVGDGLGERIRGVLVRARRPGGWRPAGRRPRRGPAPGRGGRARPGRAARSASAAR